MQKQELIEIIEKDFEEIFNKFKEKAKLEMKNWLDTAFDYGINLVSDTESEANTFDEIIELLNNLRNAQKESEALNYIFEICKKYSKGTMIAIQEKENIKILKSTKDNMEGKMISYETVLRNLQNDKNITLIENKIGKKSIYIILNFPFLRTSYYRFLLELFCFVILVNKKKQKEDKYVNIHNNIDIENNSVNSFLENSKTREEVVETYNNNDYLESLAIKNDSFINNEIVPNNTIEPIVNTKEHVVNTNNLLENNLKKEHIIRNPVDRYIKLVIEELLMYEGEKIEQGKKENRIYDYIKQAVDAGLEQLVRKYGVDAVENFHQEFINKICEGQIEKAGTNYKLKINQYLQI
ncbi:MAG: hypothetical protein N2505_00205 [Endomicrobia bacterium]|nr:hypothetical protein [Endomicrobiia bacterium]